MKPTMLALTAAAAIALNPIQPAQAQQTLRTAYTYCYLYGQAASGRNWQFYISEIGEIQSPTGEGWPDSPRDPIAKRWRAHLIEQGAAVEEYERTSNPDFPECQGYGKLDDAVKYRTHTLSEVRKSSGGYTVHELPWKPSGVNQ